MTLNDLPAFAVEEITEASGELRVRGRFSHLTGVHLGSSNLYYGDGQWPGELIECDATSRNAVFVCPSWVPRDPIKVGSVVPWLTAGWQFFHVNMILSSRWDRRAFVPSDSQHFRVGTTHGWTKAGEPLSSHYELTHIEKGGWDHEECEICYSHIGRGGLPEGFVNQQDKWLCQACYERYAQTKDLSFVVVT